MRAAWYERQGAAADVLVVGSMPAPEPGPGEVRVRVVASGINPGDVKKRQGTFGLAMPYPRVVPHSDGAGVIDKVGEAVAPSRLGERVWCFGAQSYRAFGTAAEFVVVPAGQAVPMAGDVSFEQAACLGIPGITAHRAVHVAGPPGGRSVLVQGGAGAVGQCAVALARLAGPRVLATVRSEATRVVAQRAGAHQVIVTAGHSTEALAESIRTHVPEGVDHVVEVAFDSNIALDERVLRLGGTVATYATGSTTTALPYWPLAFKNVAVFFLGSDDVPAPAKADAAAALNEALRHGWAGFDIAASLPLGEIVAAHEAVERGASRGRIVLTVKPEAA